MQPTCLNQMKHRQNISIEIRDGIFFCFGDTCLGGQMVNNIRFGHHIVPHLPLADISTYISYIGLAVNGRQLVFSAYSNYRTIDLLQRRNQITREITTCPGNNNVFTREIRRNIINLCVHQKPSNQVIGGPANQSKSISGSSKAILRSSSGSYTCEVRYRRWTGP